MIREPRQQGGAGAETSSSIVTKLSRVMDVVTSSSAPLGFAQVVSLAELPKSSTHRLLSILVGEGLLEHDVTNRTYQPGPRLVGWAVGALNANDLPRLAAPAMERLHAQSGMHVCLSILDAQGVLYIKTIDAGEPDRMTPRVGEHSPVHASAAGKAMLAHVGEGRRRAWLADATLERCTEHTITGRRAFETELRRVRDAGYATCDREEFLRVVGIAAPVIGHGDTTVAAVSLWTTVDRAGLPELLTHRAALVATARGLSERLGGLPQ
jgi:DNA-binding IclR family transcriptional regulator